MHRICASAALFFQRAYELFSEFTCVSPRAAAERPDPERKTPLDSIALRCETERGAASDVQNSSLGSDESTSTVMVPLTFSDVSTVTLQPSGGRATATGKPDAATTCTRTEAICGKTSRSQKSKAQVVAWLCES